MRPKPRGAGSKAVADPAELNGLLAHCALTHDDTPRLVLADWLEEHGDFRSEFVRAAVAFDRTPPYDVTRFQLGERLWALLEARAFTKWLPKRPASKWGWRRGLLSLSADTDLLQAEDSTEVAGWLASNWIERVEFDYARPAPCWEETFGLVRNTRELHFDTDNYGADALKRLREWPHLRSLRMSYLMKPWADLAALPHLRALKLDNPDWTMMPELHKASLPNLEVLRLDKEWEDDLPHWARCFPKLRSLTLIQYNAYPDVQCERFAECSQLRHLGFHQKYEPFTRVGLKALAKLKELRSLALGPLPRGTLAGLAKLSKLEHLATGGDAKLIRGLESLTQLRWLSLGVDTLTRGLASQVLGLPQLARLDLYLKTFEAGALAELAKAPSLRALTLTTQDDQSPLAELVRLEQLRYLWLGDRCLAKQELLSLQTALPACRIIRVPPYMDEDEYDWS
jgi:uncharacterized protein (TIGR02996 family)